MTTIGNHHHGVTLSPSHPTVTVTGHLTGDSRVQGITYVDTLTHRTINLDFDAALQGTAAIAFDLLNLGDIDSRGTQRLDTGIFLNFAGTVTNHGTIEGATGLEIFGTSGTATIDNTALIDGRTRDGLYLRSASRILNTGTIAGQTGIYSGGISPFLFQLVNGGDITGTSHAGIALHGDLGDITNSLSATIQGGSLGVGLYAGGTLTNSGDIRATGGGIVLGAAGTVTNHGTIASADSYGIRIWAGAVTNTGDITATGAGIVSTGDGIIPTGQLTVMNAGDIATTYGNAVDLLDGGTVVNTGSLYALNGIIITAGGTVDNAGLIATHAGGAGVFLTNGGKVDNTGRIAGSEGIHLGFGPTAIVDNTGTIIAKYFEGVFLAGAGTVENTGRISGYSDGVLLGGGGLLTNAGTISAYAGILAYGQATIDNTGIITGKAVAIALAAGGTITNAGTITAAGTAIAFASGAADRLIITAGSRIIGTVDGGGGVLEFAAGTTAGTLTAAEATQFTSFSSLQIDQGAIWDFAGDLTLGSPLLNDGTLSQNAGAAITIKGPLTGTGAVELTHGRLSLESTVAGGQTISFTGTGDILALGDAAGFAASIAKFALGDTIDLTGIALSAITATHFVHGVLTLAGGTTHLEFTFANPATFGTETFALKAAGAGTEITLSPAPAALLPVTPASTPAPLSTFGN